MMLSIYMICLSSKKIAYLRHPVPTAKERIDRLARLKESW